jgi:hypothetical protein
VSCPCPECNNEWGDECLYEQIERLQNRNAFLQDMLAGAVERLVSHEPSLTRRGMWDSIRADKTTAADLRAILGEALARPDPDSCPGCNPFAGTHGWLCEKHKGQR